MAVATRVDPQSLDEVFPQVSVGTDVTVNSDNYWSITLHYVEIEAQYRGDKIAYVQLTQGLHVPRQGSATFPVDLTPDVENPAQSGQHYASDCVVPQSEQASAGATAGLPIAGGTAGDHSGTPTDPTWPMTLVITVKIWSWSSAGVAISPTFSVTIPEIAVPCASAAANSMSTTALSGPENGGQESECLIGS